MSGSILMAFNDSDSSRAALDFLARMTAWFGRSHVTLLHVFRKPTAGEDLMGKKFMRAAPLRIKEAMEKARLELIAHGFAPENITVTLVDTPYATVSDGIIDQFNQGDYDLVVIGRKRMSKAEEFVLGDPSIRLVRALESTAVMVVKQ